MKLLRFKVVLFVIFWLFTVSHGAMAEPAKALYPHWDFKNKAQVEHLAAIDSFIEKNKNSGVVAVLDWDGTVYAENIKVKEDKKIGISSGQPLWHIWAAYHDKTLLPLLRTGEDEKTQIENIVLKDGYLEGKTDVKADGYNKFSQIAVFEAGMTPAELTDGVLRYLDDYPPKNFVFYPVLDVVQRLADSGFKVWLVTGSNPYFVAAVLKKIEGTCFYTKDRKYDFKISIAGNGAKLSKDGKFTMIYDDEFVKKGSEGKLYIIEKAGKTIAVQNYIEPKEKGKAIFCAGNSGGDAEMVDYVLKDKDALCIAVNPRGELEKSLTKYPDNLIQLEAKSATGVK